MIDLYVIKSFTNESFWIESFTNDFCLIKSFTCDSLNLERNPYYKSLVTNDSLLCEQIVHERFILVRIIRDKLFNLRLKIVREWLILDKSFVDDSTLVKSFANVLGHV